MTSKPEHVHKRSSGLCGGCMPVSCPHAAVVFLGCYCEVVLVQLKTLQLCNCTMAFSLSYNTLHKAKSSGLRETIPARLGKVIPGRKQAQPLLQLLLQTLKGGMRPICFAAHTEVTTTSSTLGKLCIHTSLLCLLWFLIKLWKLQFLDIKWVTAVAESVAVFPHCCYLNQGTSLTLHCPSEPPHYVPTQIFVPVLGDSWPELAFGFCSKERTTNS